MKKVLVFDSGVGGFSIVRALIAKGLDISIDYLADTFYFPYGNKNDLDLLERIPQIVAKGIEKTNAEAVIIACNTASTIALWRIREIANIPIIGVVPAIKPAAKMTKTNAIGLLATPRTIGSAYVDDLIEQYAENCNVIRYGPPNLALAAEQKLRGEMVNIDYIKDAIDGIYKHIGANEIDIIILACTHYPLLKDELGELAPKGVNFIDSSDAIARRLKDVLQLNENENAQLGIAYSTGGDDKNYFFAAQNEGFANSDIIS